MFNIIKEKQHFYGLGFGIEKEFLPNNLKSFNQQLGKLLLRISNANHSINIQFKNDFRVGTFFKGEGTDFGSTGSMRISYSNVLNSLETYHIGLGVSLFTPIPDYSRTPVNSINSDDGSKNVWYTLSPYQNHFYSNIYTFGGYQNELYSTYFKIGLNSEKLGAYIQNTLHDSFGLNPRFPWNVISKDLFFFEINGSVFNSIKDNE